MRSLSSLVPPSPVGRPAVPVGLAALAAAVAFGCAPQALLCGDMDPRPECGGDPSVIVKIAVTPDGVLKEVELGSGQRHTICYQALATSRSGLEANVTKTAFWTVDRPELGSFEGSCLTTAETLASGGIVRVRASLGGGAPGEATLVLKLRGTSANDGVDVGAFAGAPATDPAAKPQLVYPLDGAMHARNIAQMNVQFRAGQGNSVFRLRLVSSQLDYTTTFRPTSCNGDACQWLVPEALWKLVARTSGGATAKVTLSGSDGAGGKVAQADSIQLAFSPDDVIGGLYYFSTSGFGGGGGILRLPFDKEGAARKATPFIIPGSPSNPKDCAGCHAVTQRGDRITATYGHGDDFLGIASAADATRFSKTPGDVRSNFQWFNPDGTKLISNFNGELILRDGATGAELGRVAKSSIGPNGKQRAVMPEWSHDGAHIVFVRLPPGGGMFYDSADCCGKKDGGDWLITDAGEIAVLPYDSGNFGDARVVVPIDEGRDYHYYPTFSPDDQWIVFNSGSRPGFSPPAQGDVGGFSYGVPKDKLVSYDQRTSRLRMVRTTGGAVIELARATVGPGLTTSWPKFTPFVQKGGKLMFITYSSKMDYGFVVQGGNRPQIWMAAIDLGRLGENGGDPSFAPFWLPFQDDRESNHIPIWTTQLICEKDADCPGEFICDKGHCGCDVDKGCGKNM